MAEKITSRTNEKIKEAAALLVSPKNRRQRSEILIEGLRICVDAAESGLVVKRLFFTENAFERSQAMQTLTDAASESYEITMEIAEKLSSTKSTQGVFCVCEKPENTLDESRIQPGGCFMALESVRNPENLGAICRTAEALGIDGAVFFDCCDPFSPKALRASMGSLFRLPVLACDDLNGLLEKLVSRNVRVFATTPRTQALDITRIDMSAGAVAVIGNEADGVSEECMKRCIAVTIPMRGRAESLNAAMAASLVMWEMVRSRG